MESSNVPKLCILYLYRSIFLLGLRESSQGLHVVKRTSNVKIRCVCLGLPCYQRNLGVTDFLNVFILLAVFEC
ncbi:hypothetical protein CsSME_00037104 [Camellia sinensis var. sinensis]